MGNMDDGKWIILLTVTEWTFINQINKPFQTHAITTSLSVRPSLPPSQTIHLIQCENIRCYYKHEVVAVVLGEDECVTLGAV